MPFGFGGSKKEEEDKENAHSIKKPLPYGRDDLQEINKITEMLNPEEKVLLVARQSRIRPGGSHLTPNIIYATDRRIIIRDPYMLGIKENVVDIPYDIITSIKLEKGLFSSTIRFKAPGLMSSTRLGMMDGLIDGSSEDNDQGGVIEAIPKNKADDLIEIIRSGMQSSKKLQPSQKQRSFEPLESQEQVISPNQSLSVADELRKLAKLKEEGILTEEEFKQMKEDLIKKNT
jgi:hypothetical protein